MGLTLLVLVTGILVLLWDSYIHYIHMLLLVNERLEARTRAYASSHHIICPEDSSILAFFLLKDNEKKNILAVQTLRNTIMGSTLMATTSILLSTGLAAVISSTYSVKKPLNDAVYGAHGEFTVALKYATLLTLFLFSFLCHSLSICFINQVSILINSTQDSDGAVSPEYVAALLEKGCVLNTVGNRIFYAGLPLLLWIFGPVLVFLCSLTLVPILYNLDFVFLISDYPKPNPKSISNTSATDVTITSTSFA